MNSKWIVWGSLSKGALLSGLILAPLYGCSNVEAQEWNFLIGKCVLKDSDASGCSEQEARKRMGAATYNIFFKEKIEIFIWDPTVIPKSNRMDIKLIADAVEYIYDSNSRGVIVKIRTKEGCISSDLYTMNPNGATVSVKSLDLNGSCTERQRLTNEIVMKLQAQRGPSVWRLMPVSGNSADDSL